MKYTKVASAHKVVNRELSLLWIGSIMNLHIDRAKTYLENTKNDRVLVWTNNDGFLKMYDEVEYIHFR